MPNWIQERLQNSRHLLVLKTLIDTYKLKRKPIFACFIDFRKAYDSVWREGLFYKLIINGCSKKFIRLMLKGQCQLQCIARSNNAWRPFYWQSNSCFGFQSVIYFNHPMVILAHFNRIVTTKHQRNVYNRYLLTFHHFQGKM